jgi:hypothetical protein
LVLLALLWVVGAVRPCSAGVPLVSRIEVTDVTPASFAVVWQSSEPATGGLHLFAGDCVTPLANPVLAGEESGRSGFIKMTVSELSANTAYCFKTATTSLSSSETALYPVLPVSVATEKAVIRDTIVNGTSVPFANDLLRVPPPYLATESDSPDGFLVTLQLLDGKGNTPLSLLLTAGDTRNYFNMNNLFGPKDGLSVNLTGGERVKITERHGFLGCTAIDRFRRVPADLEVTKESSFSPCSSSYDIDCNSKVNILDILRVARGNNTAAGSICFNSDLDINGDGSVDQLDVTAVTGGFDATTP